MRVIILAGGKGLRMDYGERIPKSLVPIGGKPIIEHVMNIYAVQGFDDFIIAAGHMGDRLKKWHENANLPWQDQVVYTGEDTPTAGRIKILSNLGFIHATFFATYADGIADLDLQRLLQTHEANPNAQVTVTAVQPRSQFGVLDLGSGDQVIGFRETTATIYLSFPTISQGTLSVILC